MEFGVPRSVLDPQIMNPGLKTLCLSSINQPRCLVVTKPIFCQLGFPGWTSPIFTASRTHPEEMFMASVLTAPSANTEPPRMKTGSWETGRADPACNSLALEFISGFLGEAGRTPCTSPSSDMQGFGAEEGFGWLPFPTQRKAEQGCLPGRTRKQPWIESDCGAG